MISTRNTPPTGSKVLFVDVMRNGRYVFTLKYRYCPIFKIDPNDIYEKVLEKRPTLRNDDLELYID